MSSHYYNCIECNAERRFVDAGARVNRHCFECDDWMLFERAESVNGDRDLTNQIHPQERIEMLKGD